jgi:hypothetical protein
MSKKTSTLKILADYFIQKGKILSLKEYRVQPDAPIRARTVLRIFSPWARVSKMIQKNFPDEFARITSAEVDSEVLEKAEKLVKEDTSVTKEEELKAKLDIFKGLAATSEIPKQEGLINEDEKPKE